MNPNAVHDHSQASGDGEAGYNRIDGEPLRVAVAINDAPTRELCISVLNGAGYDVEAISEDQQIQQELCRESPVVLLIDESFDLVIESEASRESRTAAGSGCS